MSKHLQKTRTASLVAIFSCVLLTSSLLIPTQSALADGIETPHVVHHHHYSPLPPERHVIEGVHPPGSGIFLINGRYFAAASLACATWLPGDRIRLLAGDWHGYCDIAVFRNLRRGSTCTMRC
jgi:hypothetical protein